MNDPMPPSDAPPTPAHQLGYGHHFGYAGSAVVYDNASRTDTAKLLLIIYGVLALVVGLLDTLPSFTSSSVYEYARSQDDPFEANSSAFTMLSCGGGCISGIVGIFMIVYYMMWQYRAAWNINAAGGKTVFTPGWGVGFWFIPLAGFILGPMMMFSMWHQSGRGKKPGGNFGSPLTVILLWAAVIVLAICGVILDIVAVEQYGPRDSIGLSLIHIGGIFYLLSTVAGAIMYFATAAFVTEIQSVAPPVTAFPNTAY